MGYRYRYRAKQTQTANANQTQTQQKNAPAVRENSQAGQILELMNPEIDPLALFSEARSEGARNGSDTKDIRSLSRRHFISPLARDSRPAPQALSTSTVTMATAA